MGRRSGKNKVRFTTLISEDADQKMRSYSEETCEAFTDIAERGILLATNQIATNGESYLSLPILATVPCGAWSEAFTDGSARMLLNIDLRWELNANENDILVRTRGQSMEGAHILDDSLLLLERLPRFKFPPRDQPALVQAFDNNGEAFGTIKFYRMENDKPVLYQKPADGKEREFKLPIKAVRVEAVAVVKRAIIAF